MTITDMTLPDEVVKKIAQTIRYVNDTHHKLDDKIIAKDLIRAALQAMCDCGMAKIETKYILHDDPPTKWLTIRLDADARKREEQKNEAT